MYKPINGYTKESMIETIEREFTGKAVNENDYSQCFYRSPTGQKCAIGCFIKDEEYYAGFENKGVEFVMGEIRLPLIYTAAIQFQYKHDNLSNEISANAQKQELIAWIEQNVE